MPTAMNIAELMAEGKTRAEADHIMCERVFGVGYKRDANGKPIEQARPLDSFHQSALAAATRRGLD
jgi:hypothetical protein